MQGAKAWWNVPQTMGYGKENRIGNGTPGAGATTNRENRLFLDATSTSFFVDCGKASQVIYNTWRSQPDDVKIPNFISCKDAFGVALNKWTIS